MSQSPKTKSKTGVKHDLGMNHDLEQHAGRTDQLNAYREAVGIHDLIDTSVRPAGRVRQNVGVYKRVIREESKAKFQYYTTAILIDSCLLLQVIFAAALTALGASESSHIIITIFGAINTVLAGILSFTKGQGLPNRLRLYQGNMRKVREYIEQRERDFHQPYCKLNLDHEIETVIELYTLARQNDEDMNPNTYKNPAAPSTTGANPSGGGELRKQSSANAERLSILLTNSKDRSEQERRASEHSTRSEARDIQT